MGKDEGKDWEYVMTASHYRLTTKHATDLVWLHSNMCLAKRMRALEQLHQAQPWVVVLEAEEEQWEGSGNRGKWSEGGHVDTE